MKVLVVEDDPEIAGLVAKVLVNDGHEVSQVSSGSAALRASILHEYDLMVCDLMLPDLQGTEIVRAIKAQSPRLPVMVMSALDAQDWEKPCEDAGATKYLQKPINLKLFREEVALVEKARLRLHIAIVDSDAIHATRLRKVLHALGCQVTTYVGAQEARAGIEAGDPAGLLVVDADLPEAGALIEWGKERSLPAFAMAGGGSEASEDLLMRAGAAFVLQKPVDVDSLLTQAQFMAGS